MFPSIFGLLAYLRKCQHIIGPYFWTCELKWCFLVHLFEKKIGSQKIWKSEPKHFVWFIFEKWATNFSSNFPALATLLSRVSGEPFFDSSTFAKMLLSVTGYNSYHFFELEIWMSIVEFYELLDFNTQNFLKPFFEFAKRVSLFGCWTFRRYDLDCTQCKILTILIVQLRTVLPDLQVFES